MQSAATDVLRHLDVLPHASVLCYLGPRQRQMWVALQDEA
eukprot:CAMPEP_0195043756 /NCGR_PEP_ID=MMETSP0347-20130606/5666_1 /TAXON_ID=2932 /ORGANISM="Alexandrium fundyense, Strain CCMP1719" /LENGTH=39 /DNA_ID= /DNA_START= /DNA_END= /DNA_ORIENTATION=